jgi:hypothetical protein
VTGRPVSGVDAVEAAMVAAAAKARRLAAVPAPTLDERADRAVPRAVAFAQAVREAAPVATARIGDLLADMDTTDLIDTCIALAALCPADTDPATDLAWLREAPVNWPAETVYREAARWEDGARDPIAVAGQGELGRRFRRTLRDARREGPA